MQEKYMNAAINESKKAFLSDEMPVGAVIVYNNKIIARGYNKKEKNKNSLMHAEIIAINRACKKIGDWRLNSCTMYVTMEPCIMCMGAIVECRIKKLVYGIENKKSHMINKKICKENNIEIFSNIFQNEINNQLNMFFKNIRNK